MRPEVNLLPKYERYSDLSYILFIIFLLLFLVLAGISTYFFFKEKSLLAEHEVNISALTEEKVLLEARLSAVSETDDTTSFSDAVVFAESHAVPVSKLVNEHMELLPDRTFLVDYRYDYQTVTMETHFETLIDTARYMESLTNSPYSLNARVNEIETENPEAVVTSDNEEDVEMKIDYDIVPRYEAIYSIDVDQLELMVEEEEDE